jgi:hypothetical protein
MRNLQRLDTIVALVELYPGLRLFLLVSDTRFVVLIERLSGLL